MEQRGESWRETARSVAEVMGLGAKRLTDAARRQIELSDLRAGINAALRELGELLYATHTGTPTDSEALLAKMEEIDRLKARGPGAGGRPGGASALSPLRPGGAARRCILPGLR